MVSNSYRRNAEAAKSPAVATQEACGTEAEGMHSLPDSSAPNRRNAAKHGEDIGPAQCGKLFQTFTRKSAFKAQMTAFQRARALGAQLQQGRVVTNPSRASQEWCAEIAKGKDHLFVALAQQPPEDIKPEHD